MTESWMVGGAVAIGVLLAAALIWTLVRLVQWACKGGGSALLAAAALFGIGSVADPQQQRVLQADEHKSRKGNESGDPPDPAE